MEQLSLQNAKVVSTLGTKDEGTTKDNCNEPLEESDATKYRAIVARCN